MFYKNVQWIQYACQRTVFVQICTGKHEDAKENKFYQASILNTKNNKWNIKDFK